MNATSKISVDLTRQNVGQLVNAVQGDGNTRLVEITLLSGGQPWTPPEDVEAAIAYMTPGGTKGLYNKLADGTTAISISGNVATIVLAPQMLTASGTVQASLVFNDSSLNRLTTFPFFVSVAINPSAGAQQNEDYIRLQWLEDKLDEYLRKAADSGAFDGKPGDNGVTFTPNVSENGDISWRNNGGLPNPQTVNIRGPQGDSTAATAAAHAAQTSAENAETHAADAATSAAAAQAAADAMGTELGHIKDDLINVNNTKADKTALASTDRRVDALYKITEGQSWQEETVETESYSNDIPSGSVLAQLNKVGGKSIVWNQLIDKSKNIKTQTISGVEFTNNDDGTITLNGTASKYIFIIINQPRVLANHKHLFVCIEGGSDSTYYVQADYFSYIYSGAKVATPASSGLISVRIGVQKDVVLNNVVFKPQLFDLTAMFGAGNEPSTVEEFEAMFPAYYYPYCEPTIISSQTDRVDVASADGTISQQIPTNFPVLNSAGSVYDYIDINEGKLYTWTYIDGNEIKALTEPVITDIDIPTELTDWLEVEACGSITFHNTDDGKRLLIPNTTTYVEKLSEVSNG